MTDNLYYTPPSEEAFEEMKKCAIEIWGTYSAPYRDEKINRIKDIANVGDNFMYIFAMFDHQNQKKMVAMLSNTTLHAIRERMVAGGVDDWYLVSINI